ncbi:MAG: nucleotidyltransferase family protein [Candidatus Aenigmarchaeota archaeon]|nr:nucleotidyltransferase family protein [Candidatus Aenigmarchaeota archaeon]
MFKHRTSLEIPEELWRKISTHVSKRRRSAFMLEAIKEKLVKEAMKVVILCGGVGMQMRPLTFSSPKSMLPLGYKPLLEHMLTFYKQQGFYNFILLVGYLGEQIIKYFGDGSSLGVKIDYVGEKERLGTAGALRNARDILNSTFVCSFGDIVISGLDLKEMIQYHRERGGIATMLLSRVDDVRRFGYVEIDDKHRITNFIEKPRFPRRGLVSAGLFILEPAIFDYIEKRRKYVTLEDDVFPELIDSEKLFGFIHSGYWVDVGSPQDYEKALRDFMTKKIF